MQQVYIPKERIRGLREKKGILQELGRLCGCSLSIDDETVVVQGDAYDEFTAKNVIYAYGRGFDMVDAETLIDEGNYFGSIDLRQAFGSSKRIMQVKARIIGENGRTKRYIEQVSNVKISVYGDTVSFIGTNEAIAEAETAVSALIEGRTHKTAYEKMEAMHRRNKDAFHNPAF
jgi:ribosomal RNA assembly protein